MNKWQPSQLLCVEYDYRRIFGLSVYESAMVKWLVVRVVGDAITKAMESV